MKRMIVLVVFLGLLTVFGVIETATISLNDPALLAQNPFPPPKPPPLQDSARI